MKAIMTGLVGLPHFSQIFIRKHCTQRNSAQKLPPYCNLLLGFIHIPCHMKLAIVTAARLVVP